MVASGRDRFASLTRTLQAGRELPWRSAGRVRYEWHPIGWRLLRLALMVVAVWAVARVGLGFVRDNAIDTWSGPDSTRTARFRSAWICA